MWRLYSGGFIVLQGSQGTLFVVHRDLVEFNSDSFSVYMGVKSKKWWRMYFMPFFPLFELVPFLALLRVISSSLCSGTDWCYSNNIV